MFSYQILICKPGTSKNWQYVKTKKKQELGTKVRKKERQTKVQAFLFGQHGKICLKGMIKIYFSL